jgi:poly(A) polymerase
MTAMEKCAAPAFPEPEGRSSKLVALEGSANLAPDPMLRFLALFWKDARAVVAASVDLKMSNEEAHRLKWTVQNDAPIHVGMTPASIRGALYKTGENVFRDRVLLQWAQDLSESAPWGHIYRSADGWERPVFPVTGEDLLARGIPEGPPIGASLRRLETAWIDSDFALGRDALLAMLDCPRRPPRR